jgi:hypothetical protein
MQIQGRLKGDKEVIAALNRAPGTFLFQLRRWLEDERANMLGGKDSTGKIRKGYREILSNIPAKKKGRKWSKRVSNLFKGSIPYVKNINDLKLSMGLLSRKRHQLQTALEFLGEGGTITSSRKMPVPFIRNIRSSGYSAGMSMGSVKTGLKSKAFKFFMDNDRLTRIEDGGVTLWFDKNKRLKRGDGFRENALLFIGLRGVKVEKRLVGRRDFFARWDRISMASVNRGQTAVDKAVRQVDRLK